MSGTQAVMDVRRIELYKQFREQKANSLECPEWQVFGYYDSMNVVEVDIPKPNANGRSTQHPLECIYEDSQKQSLTADGKRKKHILYAIGINIPNEAKKAEGYRQFWEEKASHYPLLLVSLVHFKHPMSSGQTETDKLNPIKAHIQRLNKSFSDGSDGNQPVIPEPDMISAVYMAFDCNDAIVFTFTFSLSKAMQKISDIMKKDDAIQEIFTIHTCNYGILNGSREELKKSWMEHECRLKRVEVFMRDPNHHKLVADAEEFVNQYKATYPHNAALENGKTTAHIIEYFIMPGHEDVLLSMEDVPLPLFLSMYSNKEKDSGDNLQGFFINHTARAVVLAYPPKHELNPPESQTTGETEQALQLVAELKECMDLINKVQRDNRPKEPHPIWLSALMELLVELSNIEISLTAYDIYAQAIDAQETMIKTLHKTLLDETDRDAYEKNFDQIMNPRSLLSDCIQNYLNGWSRLSFHAMHSEWQLTQSSDINRLYLFPAKLCRLYSAFMKQSSKILNVLGEHEPCSFFLTPNICPQPKSLSIFRNVGKAHILINVEIPAKAMFSPQIILPTLVHEAAHYSGSVLRNRKKRNNAFMRCGLAYMFSRILKNDLLHMHENDSLNSQSSILLNELVDKLAKMFFYDYDSNDEYGDAVLDDLLNRITIFLIYPKFMDTFLTNMIPMIPYLSGMNRMEQLLSVGEYINNDVDRQDLLSISCNDNLGNVLNDIMDIFRESFSDLCMIKMLNLSLEEYLSIIYHEVQNISKFAWAQFERFWCVIEVAYGNEYAPNLQLIRFSQEKIQERLNMISAISSQDDEGILKLVDLLLKDFKTWDGESSIEEDSLQWNNYRAYVRHQIIDYLITVSNDLTERVVPDENDDVCQLRAIYQAMAVQIRAFNDANFPEFLKEITKMMSLKKSKKN